MIALAGRMTSYPAFNSALLEAVCDVLGDTSEGLTGREINALLLEVGVGDPEPTESKRHRLRAALSLCQARDGHGGLVAAFIVAAMQPARYLRATAAFHDRRAALNRVLSLAALELDEGGRLQQVAAALTLDQAVARAGRLRAELERRNVHSEVLASCRVELVAENTFHAVLEAVKGMCQRVRMLSGDTRDGVALIEAVFGSGRRPGLMAFNQLESDSERNEHTGLTSLMRGVVSAFRNPTAHELRENWPITEEDALDLLTLLSLIHRRLDRAGPVHRLPDLSP